MKTFEAFSIVMNLFMVMVLYIKFNLLKKVKGNKFIDRPIWAFVFLFCLEYNSHLFAKSSVELILGTFFNASRKSSLLCYC
jgi:hypothetical protein